MNYKIIADEVSLQRFINTLPDLQESETYMILLLCRKKYLVNGDDIPNNFVLKRSLANKENLLNKIKQMETALGTYQYNGIDIPNSALTVHITMNPRCQKSASKAMSIELLNNAYNGNFANIHTLSLNCIQKSKSKSNYKIFDFDGVALDVIREKVCKFVNSEAVSFVKTRGGVHVCIKLDKVDTKYSKTFYQKLQSLPNFDNNSSNDITTPIVGTFQGGFEVTYYEA